MAEKCLRLVFNLCVATALLLGGCGKKSDQTLLQEGIRALERGYYGRSIRLFQKAIRDTPRREEQALAYNGLGIAYYRIKQKDNATKSFENASRMDPHLVEAAYNLGVLKFESGKEAEAIVCFEKTALIDSHETRALEFVGSIYRQRRQWDEARRVLNEAQSRAPHSPRILTALALLELQTHNVERAISLLQQALEHDAHYPPALYNLAAVNQRWLNNREQALAHFKDYLSLSAEGPYADNARQAMKDIAASTPPQTTTTAKPTLLSTVVSSTPAEKEKRVPSEGKPEKRPTVESKPESAPAPPPTAEELMDNAKKLERAGRREAAVNNYLKAAREAERTGNGTLQGQALRDAVALCAEDARAHYEVGQYFLEHKQNENALTHLKQAVGLSTNWFDAHFALAKAAVEVEEFDTARVSVKQADLNKPGRADAMWSLAQFCDRHQSLNDLAVQFYSRFEKRFPDDPRAHEAQGRLKVLQGDISRQVEGAVVPGGSTNATSTSWWKWLSR